MLHLFHPKFSALKSLKRRFVNEGSLVVCILAQLVETDAGLALLNGGLLLSAIVDEFSGSKCKHLCGKPKLFFFLDEGNKQDSAAPSTTAVNAKQTFCLKLNTYSYISRLYRMPFNSPTRMLAFAHL
jgi:hypothetical protein